MGLDRQYKLPPKKLTAREVECLMCMCEGEDLKGTATMLGVSRNTVIHRLNSAYAKMGLSEQKAYAKGRMACYVLGRLRGV